MRSSERGPPPVEEGHGKRSYVWRSCILLCCYHSSTEQVTPAVQPADELLYVATQKIFLLFLFFSALFPIFEQPVT